MRPITVTTLAASCLIILASPHVASAHPGHGGHDFAGGLAHPLSGIDHLLAMLAVGMWAVQLGGHARWLVPGAFVGLMCLGGAAEWMGLHVPLVEPGILASIVVLGLLVLFAARVPVTSGMALVGLFAVFHGAAHAAEMPADGVAAAYAVGFVLTTIALHVAGIGLAILLTRMRGASWVRFCGGAITAVAALLVIMRTF